MNETDMSGAKVGVLRVSGSGERPKRAQVAEWLAGALTAQRLQVPADFPPWASRTPAGLSPWEVRVVFIAPPLCDLRRLATDGSDEYKGCTVRAWIGDLSMAATDLHMIHEEHVEDSDVVWGKRYRSWATLAHAVRDGNEEACLGCGKHTPLCDGCPGYDLYETCPGCGNDDCSGCGYDEYRQPSEEDMRHRAVRGEVNFIFNALRTDASGRDWHVEVPDGTSYVDVVIGRRVGTAIEPDMIIATSPSHAAAVCNELQARGYAAVVDRRVIRLKSETDAAVASCRACRDRCACIPTPKSVTPPESLDGGDEEEPASLF